jgi:hypothetical protein
MSKILNLWVYPQNYHGADWSEYYVILGQHRDSDILARCNWQVAVETLEALAEQLDAFDDAGDSYLQIAADSHWAVGWCDTLLLHKDSPAQLIAEAEGIVKRLQNYPILNENLFSETEEEEANETWSCFSLRERIELCAEAGISIFHARHKYYPDDDTGYIRGRLLA